MIVSVDRKRGRAMVLSDRLPSVGMILENGVWSDGAFTADDLKDNFFPVTDPEEAEALFREAALESELQERR